MEKQEWEMKVKSRLDIRGDGLRGEGNRRKERVE